MHVLMSSMKLAFLRTQTQSRRPCDASEWQQWTQLLSKCTNLTHLQQTHSFMLTRALDQDDILLSQLIHTSTTLNFPSYAYSLFTFHQNHRPLTISVYTNTINALSSSNPTRAISLFNSLRFLSLSPDSYTFPFVLKAVVSLSDVVLGKQVHSQALVAGLDLHYSVATSLLKMYSACGNHLSSARKVFDEFSLFGFQHSLVWNAMIAAYAKAGDMFNARDVFESMPQMDKNVLSWTALISGYTQVMLCITFYLVMFRYVLGLRVRLDIQLN